MIKRNFDYEVNHHQIEEKINELQSLSKELNLDLADQIEELMLKLNDLKMEKYANLTPWEKTLLTRHPDRPGSLEYIEALCSDWIELHGDRLYGDDSAIIGGIGTFEGCPLTILGHLRGKDTNENIKHNFGMPHPEGYRKVQRLLLQAEKFKRPVLMFVDTPGAYPGIGAEERGQASAIANVLMTLSRLRVPTLSIVIGQGGSGGALALALADRLLMLSNAMFAVASPEACSSIIWKDTDRVEEMAAALKITADDLMQLHLIDEIIEEPVGGAHLDPTACFSSVATAVSKYLKEIKDMEMDLLLRQRSERIRDVGQYIVSVEEKGPFLAD